MDIYNKRNKTRILSIIMIIGLGLCLYSNSLYGEFCADDYVYIVESVSIRNILNIRDIWRAYNTRFIPGMTFAFNYWLGEYNVIGYHVFNIILHIITTLMLYLFVLQLFETPYNKNSFLSNKSDLISLYAALIFMCHPLNTEAVAYTMQRTTTLVILFYLATLVCYIRFRVSTKKIYYFLSLFMMFLGLFTKEIIVTVAMTITLCEFFFFTDLKSIKQKIKYIIPFYVQVLIFLLIMHQVKQEAITQVKFVVGCDLFDWNYVFTELNVLRTYLRLLFFPVNQQFTYNYPIANGFFEAPTVLSFCLLSAILFSCVMVFKKSRLLSYSMLWFFVATSVEFTAVSFGARDVIYEHWACLSIVGFSIFLPVFLYMVIGKTKPYNIFLIFIICTMCVLTYQRNIVWQTEIGLWEDVIKKDPGMPGPYLNLGEAYRQKKMFGKSYENFKKVIEYYEKKNINPKALDETNRLIWSKTHNNLGLICFVMKKDREMIDHYYSALHIYPANVAAYNNLGFAYYYLGDYKNAIAAYNEAVNYQKGGYPDGYYYLGLSSLKLGDKTKAIEYLNQAARLYNKYRNEDKEKEIRNILDAI